MDPTEYENFLNSNLDIVHLRNIFPTEIWCDVFKKLKDIKAVDNCSNSSTYFNAILYIRRGSEVVLPQVFQILTERVYKIVSCCPSTVKETIKLSEFLKLRTLNKSFNKSIEKIIYHSNSEVYDFNEDAQPTALPFLTKWSTEKFTETQQVQKFMNHFHQTHSNNTDQISKKCPFLGKRIEVDFNLFRLEQGNHYWETLVECLLKFGHGLDFFQLNFDFGQRGGQDFLFIKLRRFAALMVNIKVMKVVYFYEGDPTEHEQRTLRNYIRRSPFGILPYIEFLSFTQVSGAIVESVVSANLHIRKLEVERCKFYGRCNLFRKNLHNLSELSLKIDSMELFENIQQCNWKLKLKKFYLLFTEEFPFLPWSAIFRVLENKFEMVSLTDLKLELPEPRNEAEQSIILEESLYDRLQLTNIERLSVSQLCYYSIDFLILTKNSLTELRMVCNTHESFDLKKNFQNQIVDIWGNEKAVHKSNINRVFYNLKVFNFTWKWEEQKVLF